MWRYWLFPLDAISFAVVSLFGRLWWKLPCFLCLPIGMRAWSFERFLEARAEVDIIKHPNKKRHGWAKARADFEAALRAPAASEPKEGES